MNTALLGGRYQLQGKLGSGGMGEVFRAYDVVYDQHVALKQIFRARALDLTLDPSVEHPTIALAREFRMLATLRHPYIIPVLDFGFGPGSRPYYTMSLLDHPRDLRMVARERDVRGKLSLIMQVLQALIYLHRRGIVHRDLKPGNVLVDVTGDLRVVDFGLSIEQENALGFVGTLAYMAPEVASNEQSLPASDLYSVGIMLYEFLAGHHPFRMDNVTNLLRDTLYHPPDVSVLPVNPALQTVVARLLAKEPTERYADARDTLQAVCEAAGLPVPYETPLIRESFLRSARFVGRQAEMDKLIHALSEALEGRGSGWLIAGESGIGKSRLVDEVRIQALVRGFRVLYCQMAEEAHEPLRPLSDALLPLVLSTDMTDLELGILKLATPAIERLVSRSIPDVPALEAQAQRQRLLNTLLVLLTRQQQPVLLILEDLHWAQGYPDFLRRLYQLTARTSLVILGTYRSDEAPYLYGKLPVETQMLPLRRLTPAEVEALAVSMLGEAARRRDVVSLVDRQSEGNVFFMIEVIQTLAESTAHLDDIGCNLLPPTVPSQGAIQSAQRRLHRLSAAHQQMVRIAALLGREIDFDLLAQVAAGVDMDDWLAACADAALLDVVDGRWRFIHDKIREGVLLDTDPASLPDMHRLTAQALMAVYPQSDFHQVRIAQHWQQAGEPDQVIQMLVRMGFRIVEVTNQHEPIRLLMEWALSHLPAEDNRRATLLNIISGIYWRHGDMARAQLLVEEALVLARGADNWQSVFDSLCQLGTLALFRHDYTVSEQLHQEALAVAQAHGLAHHKILNNIGILYGQLGRYAEAEAVLQQALVLARADGDPWLIAMRLSNLGLAVLRQGQVAQAKVYLLQGLDLFEVMGANHSIAYNLNNLGDCAYELGELTEAVAYYERSLKLKLHLDDAKWSIAHTRIHLGFALLAQEKLLQARQQFIAALGEVHATPHVPYVLEALLGVAAVARQQEFADRAAEIVALVKAHPVKNHEVQQRMNALDFCTLQQGQVSLTDEDAKGRLTALVDALLVQEQPM